MFLLCSNNYTEETCPPIGDGSFLKLTACQEGWFALKKHQHIIDSLGWNYTEVSSINPIQQEL